MAIKQQVMALNPARKGNMGRLNSSQPLYVYDTLIAQPWLKGVIAQIRGEKAIPGVDAGDEKAVKKAKEGLKRQLPIRAIHYSKFRNNHRSSEDADPESFLFQTTIDVDDVDYVDAALEKARELNCSNTIWKGKLLHLEYSARKKLHIDIRMPMGMTIEETQKAYCEAAGIPYDKSCITPERIIFITDKDSEIYRSKEWYGVLPDEEIQARREAFLKRGLTIDGKDKQNFPQISQMPQIHSGGVPDAGKSVKSVLSVEPKNNTSAGIEKVQSSNLKVQSNDDVQDNRFQGTDSHSAVSSGAAIQPAQPGNSHRVNDSHLGSAGASQDAGGVATQNASEKNLIAFELFKEAAGLKKLIEEINKRIDKQESRLHLIDNPNYVFAIADALGNKGDTSREVIRNYFLSDFFKDHEKIYQKRPIYWLFDSGKQNGFKALVYMHRWNADTIGNVRAEYLERMQKKLDSEQERMDAIIDGSSLARDITRAQKQKEKLRKQAKECADYAQKLSHLANYRLDIDLDDGVKVNYRKVQTDPNGKFFEILADSKNIMVKEKK